MFKFKSAATKIETVIGPGTELEGNIRTSESLRIDGKIKGEVQADAVVIGEFGVILGDITASQVTVGGKVKGNVQAAATLELLPKSQLLGDIKTNKLIIADGATFEGNCQMLKIDGQILELNPHMMQEGEGSGQKTLRVISNGKR